AHIFLHPAPPPRLSRRDRSKSSFSRWPRPVRHRDGGFHHQCQPDFPPCARLHHARASGNVTVDYAVAFLPLSRRFPTRLPDRHKIHRRVPTSDTHLKFRTTAAGLCVRIARGDVAKHVRPRSPPSEDQRDVPAGETRWFAPRALIARALRPAIRPRKRTPAGRHV